MMGVTVKGDKELDRWFKKQPKDLVDTMLKGLTLTNEDIKNEWQRFITSMNAIKTGDYRKSISKGLDRNLLSSEVFTRIEYAVHVELGTSRMPARPAMMSAATKIESDLLKRFIEVIRKKYT